MSTENLAARFFLGCNTPQGFVSRFDQLGNIEENWRCFILKGGPGTGKSTLLKKTAEFFGKIGQNMELIPCSSDPDSLDAVILKDCKICIADGTSPHVLEPGYPALFETIVNLFDFMDADRLQPYKEELLKLSAAQKDLHTRCCRFLSAAANLLNDTYRNALEYTDAMKIKKYAKGLAAKEFPKKDKKNATESIRFLSAVTPFGVMVLKDTVSQLCEKVYLIDDEWGASGRILLNSLKDYALENHLDVISCYCPLFPYDKLEHLIIPELRLGFITASKYAPFELEGSRTIHAKRFMDMESFKKKKQRISFNRKAASELIAQASEFMKEARSLHNRQEYLYQNCIDREGINELTEKLLKELVRLSVRFE